MKFNTVPLSARTLLKFHICLMCELLKERHSVSTLSKLSVTIRGTQQLLQTQQDFCGHKWMRYNSPTPASPKYFLVVLIYCGGSWKVRRSLLSARGVGKCSPAAEALGREQTPSAGGNWNPHKKTQQLFLHLPSTQELRARQASGPSSKGFLSLSPKATLFFLTKLVLFSILSFFLKKRTC